MTTPRIPDPPGPESAGPSPLRDAAAAEAFQSCAVPYILAPWVPDLIDAAGLEPGARVLDAACGTGAVTRPAASTAGLAGSVVGLDVNPEMIAAGKRATRIAQAPIRWVAGDAVSLPFADGSFDAVLCQQGLQFFSDRPRALLETRRVLAPGGIAVLAVWGRLALNPYMAAFVLAAGRHLGDEVARQIRTAFALGDPGDLRRLITDAGFRSVAVRSLSKVLALLPLAEFVPRHMACTSVAAAFASAGAEVQAAIVSDVARDLHVADPTRQASFHFEVNLALAR